MVLVIMMMTRMMRMMMLAQDGSHEATKHGTGRLTQDDTSPKASLWREGKLGAWLPRGTDSPDTSSETLGLARPRSLSCIMILGNRPEPTMNA